MAIPHTMYRYGVAAALGLTLTGLAHAMQFGHARLLSESGQALLADVVIVQLSPQELADLQVRLAPEAAWREAHLTPPVELSSLHVQLVDGFRAGTRVARLMSSQVFTGTVADFLIEVRTATGVLRHPVSVLAQQRAIRLADGASQTTESERPARLLVRRGDTLMHIARQHAVPGFTVYQMLAALFAVNPDAFIDGNMNLVKAGAVLQLPDTATLSALTDRQARQLFLAHARAWAQRRGRGATVAALSQTGGVVAAPATVDEPAVVDGAPAASPEEPPQDQLRLSAADVDTDATSMRVDIPLADEQTDGATQPAARGVVRDSLEHIAQLEENVQELNQVLRDLEQTGAAQGTVQGVGDATATTTASATAAAASALIMPDSAPTSGDASASAPGDAASVSGTVSAASGTAATQAAGHTSPQLPAPASIQADPSNLVWAWIAAGLALLAALVAWLRRRTRVQTSHGGKITDAMIQEKLNAIDLDLSPDDSARKP